MSPEGRHLSFLVPEDVAGERADRVIADLLDGVSRTAVKRLMRDGLITVNGKVPKPSLPLDDRMRVDVVLPPASTPELLPEEIPLDIVYEDEDLLVINKPKGMVVHPAAGHPDGTLVNAVLFHCRESLSGIGGVQRPGIVHRIDRDTTGLILVCKNDATHLAIAEQIRTHSAGRIYDALVFGLVKEDTGTIHEPIGRDPKDRKKMAVVPGGKPAVTHYEVLERFEGKAAFTRIRCRLETGRTHQIRVHMASLGHPVVGDPLYAGRKTAPFATQGQCLHAGEIRFFHPGRQEEMTLFAPLPAYYEAILARLRGL